MPSDPFLLIALAVTATAAAIMLSALPTSTRNRMHAGAIGGAAMLTNAQIANVHAFTLLVALWVLTHLDRRPKFTTSMLLLMLTTALAGSSVLTGNLVGNPKLAVQLGLLLASALALALFLKPLEYLSLTKGALALITLSSAYGVGQLIGVLPSQANMVHLDISAIGRPSGLWPEPDWLGMYCAVGVLMAWKLPLARWQRMISLPLCTLMWVSAFARGAWIALIATVVVASLASYLWRQYRQPERPNNRRTAVMLTVTSAVLALSALPALTSDLVLRLQRTIALDSDDVSGQARIQQTQGLFKLASESPWYGRGLSAAGRVGVSGKLYLDESSNSVASNWIFGLWVDSRWLAVPFIVLIAVLIVLNIRNLGGQIAAVVAISSLFSNATFMPVFWFCIAFCLGWMARPHGQTDLVVSTVPPVAPENDQIDHKNYRP